MQPVDYLTVAMFHLGSNHHDLHTQFNGNKTTTLHLEDTVAIAAGFTQYLYILEQGKQQLKFRR